MLRTFRKEPAKTAFGYVIGAGSVAAALALNLFKNNWINPEAAVLFVAAVAFTAWKGGKYPSLFAALLSVLAIDFFFQPPLRSFEASLENAVNAFVFMAVALLINWIDEARKKAVGERDALLASEREIRRAAEEANRSKDKFLAMVTHELRSPLNNILGWTQMLKKENPDPARIRRAVKVIERSAQTQAHLIDDLLDISRIRAGKFRIRAAPADLRRVIDEAIESAGASIAAKRIYLHRDLDEQAAFVNGDTDRLRQVVWNLLSNAVKFTPEEGQIEIRLERAGNHARLCVYDNGAGISPDFLPFVFDSFRQSDDAGQKNYNGLGLGLAIVRHLVEAHGGTVRAQSAGAGRGATFTVELPLLVTENSLRENLQVEAART